MPYWRLFYHLIWATKNREPLIDDPTCAAIERSIRETGRDPDVRLLAVGIMPDHIHVAVSLPPRLAPADFVGRLKGAASYAANGAHHGREARFAWQKEYGVLSFGEKALPVVVAYIRNQRERNQREHHATNKLWAPLEQATDTS